jgi:hypothetical protein
MVMRGMGGEDGASAGCCALEGRKRSAVVTVQRTLRCISQIPFDDSNTHSQLERGYNCACNQRSIIRLIRSRLARAQKSLVVRRAYMSMANSGQAFWSLPDPYHLISNFHNSRMRESSHTVEMRNKTQMYHPEDQHPNMIRRADVEAP